jgi:hypothetical protein
MTLLASRERFCLHADVSRADDKASACADATHIGKGCCTHLEKAEAIGYPQRIDYRKNFLQGGDLAVCRCPATPPRARFYTNKHNITPPPPPPAAASTTIF